MNGPDLMRRAIAGLLLTAVAVAAVASVISDAAQLRTCEQVVASVGDAAVATVCRPLAVTDASVLLVILLAMLLLLPDIKTLKIAGLIEVERQVRETKETIAEVQRSLNQIAVQSSAEVHNENNFYVDRDVLNQGKDELDKAARSFVAQPIPDPVRRANAVLPSADDPAELKSLLLSLAEDLDGLRRRAFGINRPPFRPEWAWGDEDATVESTREVLQRWWSVFKEEYEVVRAMRNRIAHDQPAEVDELRRAVHFAGRLWVYAYLGLAPAGTVHISDPRAITAMSLG